MRLARKLHEKANGVTRLLPCGNDSIPNYPLPYPQTGVGNWTPKYLHCELQPKRFS